MSRSHEACKAWLRGKSEEGRTALHLLGALLVGGQVIGDGHALRKVVDGDADGVAAAAGLVLGAVLARAARGHARLGALGAGEHSEALCACGGGSNSIDRDRKLGAGSCGVRHAVGRSCTLSSIACGGRCEGKCLGGGGDAPGLTAREGVATRATAAMAASTRLRVCTGSAGFNRWKLWGTRSVGTAKLYQALAVAGYFACSCSGLRKRMHREARVPAND